MLLWLLVFGAQAATLSTDRPVYKTGPIGVVEIRLKNLGKKVLTATWSIRKDGQAIYAATVPSTVMPKQTKTWQWNMLDTESKPVGPGSYEVVVGALSRTIAITPTGSIAGSISFPLAVGNEWRYEPVGSGAPETTAVAIKQLSWYWVTGLAGKDRWAAALGSNLVAFPSASGGIAPLFRFRRPLGYAYTTNFAPGLELATMKVGSVDETVEAPAGTFTGCYRLDAVSGQASFWFASGIGLVQYGKKWGGGMKKFRLRRADVWGTDGKQYTVGLP